MCACLCHFHCLCLFVGRVKLPHHSEHLSERTHISRSTLQFLLIKPNTEQLKRQKGERTKRKKDKKTKSAFHLWPSENCWNFSLELNCYRWCGQIFNTTLWSNYHSKSSGFSHSNFEISCNRSRWGGVVLGKKHFPLAFRTQKTFNLIADEIGEKNTWNIEIVQ